MIWLGFLALVVMVWFFCRDDSTNLQLNTGIVIELDSVLGHYRRGQMPRAAEYSG